jgi:hypothetical protein
MKTTLLLFIFSIPLMLSAQVSLGEWAAIKPVTDSSHFNRNGFITGIFSNGTLFWDQQVDETTTRLCFKDIDDSFAETKILIEQTGVHFRHPVVKELSAGASNADLVVFFQTNEGDDIDLKYIIYKPDGTQSDPVFLSMLAGDDIHLSSEPYSNVIVWENNSKIYASIFKPITGTFSQPACIEPNGGYSPVIANDVVSYLISNIDSTYMISKRIFEFQGNWIVTDSSSTSFKGTCSGLNMGSQLFGINKCMQHDSPGEKSGIIISDGWNTNYLRSEDYNYTAPTVCDYMIGVKNNTNYFLAYISDSLAQDEIFAEDPVGFNPGVQNISQWPGEDRNPQLFESFPDSYFIRVHLLWESERQGYSTIYYSYFDYIFGGTAENPKSDNFITVAPCPFDQETVISFQSSRNADVTIFDLQGRKVRSLSTQSNNNSGLQKATWDGTNQQGSTVKAGSYIVVVNSDNETHNTIVIKK